MNNLINSHKHKAKLLNDKDRMVDKQEAIHTDVSQYRIDEAKALADLELYEKRFIRDEATASELEAARVKLNEIKEKLAAEERLEQLAIVEHQNIERDIQEALKNIKTSRRDFCLAEKAAISAALNEDHKIRSRLMEAYAAYLSNGMGYNSDYKLFITSIFTQPTQEETNDAIAKFNQKHNLESVA